MFTWIGAAVVTGAVYLWGFSAKIATGSNLVWNYAENHPVSALRFFFYLIGDVVGDRTATNDGVLVLGIIIFFLAMTVVSEQWFRGARAGGGPVGVALICYGVLFAVILTQGQLRDWNRDRDRLTIHNH